MQLRNYQVHLVPKDYRLVNLSQNIIFAQLINYNLIKGPKLQQTTSHASRTKPKLKRKKEINSDYHN